MLCDINPDRSEFLPEGIACLRNHKALCLPRGKMERIGQICKVQIFTVMLGNKLMDQKTGIYDRLNAQYPMRRKAAAKQGYVCGYCGVVLREFALFNFMEKCQYSVFVQHACGEGLCVIVYLKSGVQSVCVGTVKTVKNPVGNEEYIAFPGRIYAVSNDEPGTLVGYDMYFCIIVIVKGRGAGVKIAKPIL